MLVNEKKQPGLARLIKDIKKLNNRKYQNYFKEKLGHIRRLENELKFVEDLTPDEFKDYLREHCPNIKGKHSFVQYVFFWEAHYQRQILNVVNFLKGKNKCQDHTALQQTERLLCLAK